MAIPTYRGLEIPVLSIEPDWSQQIQWHQKYTTTITEALNGREERQGRFPRPLYGLGFTTTSLSAAETVYLRSLLQKPDAVPVACPLWPLGCRLTATALDDATALALDDTTYCLFEVFSQFALLWAAFDAWQIVELSAIDSSSASLSAALSAGYEPGDLLLPLAYGHAPRANIDQLTDEHGQWECDFQEIFHRLHDQSQSESELING